MFISVLFFQLLQRPTRAASPACALLCNMLIIYIDYYNYIAPIIQRQLDPYSRSEMEISCNHLYESPIGSLQLCATSEGICAVKWLKSGEEREEVEDEETRSDGDKNYTIARQHIASCTRWLDTYFSGSLLKSPVPRPRLVLPMKSKCMHSFQDLFLPRSRFCR